MAWQIEPLGVAESTNDVARAWVLASWARGESADGLVITAARQTGGRGQHGRKWESPAGGLYMSAVLENVPMEVRGRLALVVGAAVVEALNDPRVFFEEKDAAGAPEVMVRWPNDLVVAAKEAEAGSLAHLKVGGILCESVAMGERWGSIVGIGINVVTDVEQLPKGTATSLTGHDGRVRTVTGVLDAVLEALARAAGWMAGEGIAGAVRRLERVDALKGRQVTVEVDGAAVEGLCGGMMDGGALKVGDRLLERGSVLRVGGVPTRAG